MRKFYLFVFIFLFSTIQEAYAQSLTKLTDLADEVIDFFSDTIEGDSATYPASWVVAPLVAYSPETSVQLGFGSILLFKTPKALPKDRSSFVSFTTRYTFNHQFTASPKLLIFTKEEKYIHSGRINFRKFPQFYYGIGNNTPESNEELYGINTLSLEYLLYRNVVGKLYAGAGGRFLRSYNLDFEENGILATDQPVGTQPNTSVGLDFGLLFDNRNNLMSTTTGVLAEFRHQIYRKSLGSDYDYLLSILDLRTYLTPFESRKDIFAWQVYTYFCSGETPFNELAPLGGDMIMRGYYEGRYLDQNLISTQIEYRMPIWKKLSTVAFAGLGDVAPDFKSFALDEFKYSLGGGLRYSLLPGESLNIRVDYAFGKDTQNFYINISEAF
ncbi:BamA/TamA family outer membrane protein [Catalinimonas niigatensis]|uniref:BamA/TamA family outer membrane protein n=1 Tax=Catalinimonas niigatensis TaxID=1397264 RepID=UPI002665349A|nr:BamA/TamA family outer membrane protein [Catalinimonas niigatensis]WPP48178.1 BamA/TamA family outer membrane protein [Catalinimonas niigatensis]